MKRYEYKAISLSNDICLKYKRMDRNLAIQTYFNDLGNEGWELVSVDTDKDLFYFKRELTIDPLSNSNISTK